RAVGDALACGLAEQGHEGDAEGRAAGEVADAPLHDAAGERWDAGELVHRLAEFGDVALLARAGGVAAEALDAGVRVVGAPDLPGRDGEFAEALEPAGEVHAEA